MHYITDTAGETVQWCNPVGAYAPTPSTLNAWYLLHSGHKYINESMLHLSERESFPTTLANLAVMIAPQFYRNWQRIWEAYEDTDYNPLNNYDMVESGRDDRDHRGTETGTVTSSEQGTNSSSDTESLNKNETRLSGRSGSDESESSEDRGETKTTDSKGSTVNSANTENHLTAFNTSNPASTDGSVSGTNSYVQNDGNETVNSSGSSTASVTRKETETGNVTGQEDRTVSSSGSTGRDAHEDRISARNENEHTNHYLTRSGNIGVTTSQQMLESELELRKFRFYDRIFEDVDSILCEKIFDIA